MHSITASMYLRCNSIVTPLETKDSILFAKYLDGFTYTSTDFYETQVFRLGYTFKF
jgi:hypothetical protein